MLFTINSAYWYFTSFAASDPIPSTSGLSNAKKQKLRGVPTVPFGMDLFHWGEKIETPLLVRYVYTNIFDT